MSMAASASTSFSGVDPSLWKYDVFISFRGVDTFYSVTSHLYSAFSRDHIRAYVDEKSLAKGDDFFCALFKAIEESAISIVILSLNYAASTWCLNELLHILKCKKEKNQIVVPIFVGVDPSDIRKQKNSYAEAFVKHEQRLKNTIEKVQEWRQALTEVSGLSGWVLQGTSLADSELPDQPDESLLSTIIQSIKTILTHNSPSTIQPPIKLDELNSDLLEEIEKHLDGSSSLALAQVNTQLRTDFSNMNLSGGHQPPHLMLCGSSHSETCHFLRLDDNRIIALPLPAARGKRVWGCPHGWIVTMDPTLELHFLNIFSQVQEPLPPLLPMIDCIRQNGMVTLAFLTQLDWFSMVHKCLVFKIFPTEFLVMVILRPANLLCFTKPRKIPRWVLMSNPENHVFRDAAFFQGQVYALCDNGSIVKINFHESDPAATATHLVVLNPEGETAERSYLVASPDHLYGVFRYDDEDDGRTTFVVYKLNFGSLEWEAVWSIAEYAFFVGNGNSFCFIPASRVNYRSNCIYFTYNDGEKLELMLPNAGRFDFGIYDLDTWDTDLRLVMAESVPSPHSRPTWIAHGLTPSNFRN